LIEPSYPIVKTESGSSAKYAPGPGPGNRYRYDFYGKKGFSGGGTFPRWQYSMNDRAYDRDARESLREGGQSDRRVQSSRGYNMAALITKSSY